MTGNYCHAKPARSRVFQRQSQYRLADRAKGPADAHSPFGACAAFRVRLMKISNLPALLMPTPFLSLTPSPPPFPQSARPSWTPFLPPPLFPHRARPRKGGSGNPSLPVSSRMRGPIPVPPLTACPREDGRRQPIPSRVLADAGTHPRPPVREPAPAKTVSGDPSPPVSSRMREPIPIPPLTACPREDAGGNPLPSRCPRGCGDPSLLTPTSTGRGDPRGRPSPPSPKKSRRPPLLSAIFPLPKISSPCYPPPMPSLSSLTSKSTTYSSDDTLYQLISTHIRKKRKKRETRSNQPNPRLF